ncbi:MAG TPA: hypothetical protein DC057_14515 [Spirochaetia bacterium]|nr:hypothetical protein [Spirochaetia bacterium]
MNKMIKISDEEYFNADGLSNSFLIRFDRSPAHAFMDIESTEGMKAGTLIHNFILSQEEFNKNYVIAPADIPKDKRLAGYKEYAKGQNKEILFQSDIEELEKIKSNIFSYCFEENRLEQYFTKSEKEISIFWDLFIENKIVRCKGKADVVYIQKNEAIIFDLKKVQNCMDFQKSALSYKYYRQANFYITGLKAVIPSLKSVRFVFITVEENYPYGVMTYELDENFLYEGEKENYFSILKYLGWNGDRSLVYDNETVILKKPEWLYA